MSRPDAAVAALLGVAVRIAGAAAPLAPWALSAAERARVERFPTEARRRDWLVGRAALKALLGPGADTAGLAFPHPRLSLTHAGGRAFAVTTEGPAAGVGVDYEPRRSWVDPRTARFFLGPAERAAATTADALLRLWTVKEALFKATPGNAGAVLGDYALDRPGAPGGTARGPGGALLRYATTPAAGGVLAVAVCLPEGSGRGAV